MPVPAAAATRIAAEPLVEPLSVIWPPVPPLVPSVGVAVPAMTLEDPAARIVFAAAVDGYVAVDHEGAALEPESGIWLAVAVPDRMASAEPVE